MSWVIGFIEKGGLDSLTVLIDAYFKNEAKTEADHELLHETLKCLRGLLNNKHGIKAAMASDIILGNITAGLVSPLPSSKRLILEIMSVMSCVDPPKGHAKVLKAFRHFKTLSKGKRLFETIVRDMAAIAKQQPEKNREHMEFLVEPLRFSIFFFFSHHFRPTQFTATTFVNAMIMRADDLDYSIHLRNEFYASGLADVIEVGLFPPPFPKSFSHLPRLT